MKNITFYSLLLLLLTLCFSCVKEADLITEEETEVIIQEGETRLLTGIVRDTAGAILSQASVKIILGDLELATETDENGEWNLTVPNSLTKGYVVANKVEYSKTIQRFKETAEHHVEDIYLASDQSNTELDLSFVESNLKTVIGRFVDENANPISNVTLILESVLEGPPMEYVFNGFQSPLADGTFEFIYEDVGFSSTTLYTLFQGACGDNPSFAVPGQDPIEDLGDLVLGFENFTLFQTSLESDGSNCYDNVSTLAYHYSLETGFLPVSYNQPLGAISLEYCPDENAAFYLGVESEDNAHFNGLWASEAEVEESYMIDICTPNPGNFLEVNLDGNQMLFEDDLLFIAPRTIISQNEDLPLSFTVLNWVTVTPLGGTKPAYQIGEIKSLTMQGANGNDLYDLDEDSPINFVNIVQDDDVIYAGLAKAKLKVNNGSTAEIDIRFRVSK